MKEIKFQWDENKNKSNIEKHKLSFDEASKVFYDINLLTFPDNRKDYGEIRLISIGKVHLELDDSVIILMVVHTDRNGYLRIISARKANALERATYAKAKNPF